MLLYQCAHWITSTFEIDFIKILKKYLIDFMERGLCDMGKNNPDTVAKYNKEHYESRNVRFKKEHNVTDRLKDASIICNKSVNSIIEEAVLEWLKNHEL